MILAFGSGLQTQCANRVNPPHATIFKVMGLSRSEKTTQISSENMCARYFKKFRLHHVGTHGRGTIIAWQAGAVSRGLHDGSLAGTRFRIRPQIEALESRESQNTRLDHRERRSTLAVSIRIVAQNVGAQHRRRQPSFESDASAFAPPLPLLKVHLVRPNGVRHELRVTSPGDELPLLFLFLRLPGVELEQHELLEAREAVKLALSLPEKRDRKCRDGTR